MSEVHSKEEGLWQDYMEKLEKLCLDHHLEFRFQITAYPIELTIQPMKDEQMTLEDLAEKVEAGKDPFTKMVFSLEDGEIFFRSHGTYSISKTVLSKIQGLFEKMAVLAVQFYFRWNPKDKMRLIDDGEIHSSGFVSRG